jgi:PhzF family phenazine biosynthesis protein
MPQSIIVVDAFAERPFTGNPAAVCVTDRPRDAAWMQIVAREMNLSETAFVHPIEEGFALRWFTPAVEVDLCGHATLASAHVLWEMSALTPDTAARFSTRSGWLSCSRRADGWIEMDFPVLQVTAAAPLAGLTEALGAHPAFVGKTRMDGFVELSDEATLRALTPDISALSRVEARGVIVTARASSAGYDFVSRFFAPRAGVNEDPVTGSAHCALSTYWAAKLGKQRMRAYQASARGGTVEVALRSDRVILAGQAFTVLRAQLVAS